MIETESQESTPEKQGLFSRIVRQPDWKIGLIVGMSFGLLCIGIYFLSFDTRREIRALATANADSRQWSIAQTEVDLLRFQIALTSAQEIENPNLSDVRKRFDVFYSRIATLENSRVFQNLQDYDQAVQKIEQLIAFREDTTAIIDGADQSLIEALEPLAAETKEMRTVARELSFSAIKLFSTISEQQRTRVSQALLRLGILTFCLVALLSALVLALVKLFATARKQSSRVRGTQRRLGAMVSASLDAILVTDQAGRIIDFNQAAEGIFGWKAADIIGKPLSETIVPEHYRDAHSTGMKRYITTGEKRVIDKGRVRLEAVHALGHIFPIEISISSAQGKDEEIFVSYIRDISLRIEREEELVDARDKAVSGERAKAEMMAVMSHEMRTPLNGILGTLDLVDSEKLDPDQRKFHEVIGKSARVLLNHVNDVLDISKLESPATQMSVAAFDPIQICEDVVDGLRGAAQQNGTTIALNSGQIKTELVNADAAMLQQILTNLVGNAIKFTRDGQVTLNVTEDADINSWFFSIVDDGVGIPEADLDRIFEDFVVLDSSYSRSNEGTGLGLAIVKRIVERMEGKIEVNSSINLGSEFRVTLPLEPAVGPDDSLSADEKTHNSGSVNSSTTYDILIVEDDEINRFVACGILNKLGHRTTTAENGHAGVETAMQQKFDLILMDISMPGMDGVTAAKTILSETGLNQSTPIVALTAHALEKDVARFKEAGMRDVLVKPMSSALVSDLLERLSVQRQRGETQLVNNQILNELVETVGPEKFKELMACFTSETDTGFGTLNTLDLPESAEEIMRIIHKMSGAAATFGAVQLREALNTAHDHAEDRHSANWSGAMKHAIEVWGVTQKQL